MNLKTIVIGIAMLIVISVIFVSARNMIGGQAVSTDSVTGAAITNEVQNVKLSYINGKYEMAPNVLKLNVPVRMEVDLNTVQGCMQTVTIPAFNVAKHVQQGDSIIDFTPTKAGVFNIACSMGMGRNTFTVQDSSGSATYVEPAKQSTGGSCGISGCGCGGK
jgi:plastocyanin domain-containing protein